MSIDRCSVIKYPTSWGFRREPSRPVELRLDDRHTGASFDEMFDWDNIWHDAFQINPNIIILIGPPLLNTREYIEKNCAFVSDSGEILKAKCIDMDRVGYTIIQVSGWKNELTMHPGAVTIKISKYDSIFTDQHTIITGQKDNPISWIRGWISYHRDIHCIKHFLIYNNNSTIYSIEQLDESLTDLGVTVKLVEWDVPHGPFGVDFGGGNWVWDSDFSYPTMLEHAKRKYLTGARSASNLFPDELLLLKDGNLDNIVDCMLQEGVAGYRFNGPWIEPYDIVNNISADKIPFEDRKYIDYYCTDSNNLQSLVTKYIVIPRLAMDGQWGPHSVNAPMRHNNDISYGHFLAMNTNWSWKRDEYTRDPINLKVLETLKSNLSKVNWQ